MLPAETKNRSSIKKLLRHWLFVRPIVRELRGLTLDIGCGTGDFMRAYRGESVGIDNEPLCVSCCQSQGLDVVLRDAHDYQPLQKFDSILLHCLLEHVDRPTEVLRRTDQMLNSGGRVVITLPCMANFILGLNDWYGHKQFVTVEYVDRCLVQELGYRRIQRRTFPPIDLPYLWRYREVRCIYEKP